MRGQCGRCGRYRPAIFWRTGDTEPALASISADFRRVDSHVRDHHNGRQRAGRRDFDRMPLILASSDYNRWLSDEPDHGDLMRRFPAQPMRMWPISTRVNKPENDDPLIVEPIALATSAA